MAWVYYHEVLLFTEHQKPIRDTISKKYLVDEGDTNICIGIWNLKELKF